MPCKAEGGETRRTLVTVTTDKSGTCHPDDDNLSWELGDLKKNSSNWNSVDKSQLKVHSITGRQENKDTEYTQHWGK